MAPRVFVIDPISQRALAALSAAASVVRWDDSAVCNWPDEADGLIVRTSKIAGPDIARSKTLRVIGKHGVGVDNIDVDTAAKRGIAVVRTPGANAYSVAELVLALAMAAARNIAMLDAQLRAGKRGMPGGLSSASLGRELKGCTLGILGYGASGQATAALFKGAFGAKVLNYLPAGRPAPAGVDSVSLNELLSKSDIVSVHLPLTSQTKNLIGARELALMQPNSILVNTARGGIVDEAALFDALKKGSPAVAAFDVFVVEPPPPDHPLLSLPNFIATPHIGSATSEALDNVGLAVVRNVLEVLR